MTRVLIGGGYGLVGSWAARLLRAAGHDLELVLGGRQPEAGDALARELGAATVRLDTEDTASVSAAVAGADLVISILQDPNDHLQMAALRAGASWLGIVRKADTVGPTAVAAAVLAQRGALVMGHWQAGVTTFAALDAARAFARVDRIAIGALFDPADPIGPMTAHDQGGFFSRALARREGAWLWTAQGEAPRTVERDGGPPFQAQPMGVLDVPGLAAATGASDVRFDIGLGASRGTLAGGAASHEIHIDLAGEGPDGRPLAVRAEVSDPQGQAHLTALGALIGAERLLGLDGALPLGAGLHAIERVIDPVWAVERLRGFGVSVERRVV